MATVELKNIKKVYPAAEREKKHRTKLFGKNADDQKTSHAKPGVAAVEDFNLCVADKEFVVFVGPSGCGKSTTLRMIAGLEEISEGELFIDGKRVNDIDGKDRDVAMVFQNYALYPHMTCYENMSFSLKLKHTPKNEIDRRVREAAAILDITDYLDRKPKALSGGQRQRVAIGRAIVRDPAVFLMDEPLSNLDAKLRNQMRSELIKLHERLQSTFIYVTHDQTEAMTLGDRIVVMRDGKIQQIGTPQEVFNHPVNLFVAGFIGTPQMNILDGELLLKDNVYYANVCGTEIRLPEDRQVILKNKELSSQKVKIGIRPEHINIQNNGVAATMDVAEMMGSLGYLHVMIENQAITISIPVDEGMRLYKTGDALSISIPAAKMHLFDVSTGLSLLM